VAGGEVLGEGIRRIVSQLGVFETHRGRSLSRF
jgi:hypothetical protein